MFLIDGVLRKSGHFFFFSLFFPFSAATFPTRPFCRFRFRSICPSRILRLRIRPSCPSPSSISKRIVNSTRVSFVACLQVTPRKRKKQPGFQNAPAQNPPFVPMYFHEMAFRHQKITQSLSSFVHHPFGPAPLPLPPSMDDSRDTAPSAPRTPIYMGRPRSHDSGVYRPPALPPPPDDSPPPPSSQPPSQSSSFRFAENGSPWQPCGGTYAPRKRVRVLSFSLFILPPLSLSLVIFLSRNTLYSSFTWKNTARKMKNHIRAQTSRETC